MQIDPRDDNCLSFFLLTMVLFNITASMHILVHSLQSAPVCSVLIALLDLDTGENFLGNAQLSINNITFSAAQLTPNRHYNVSVRASNVIGTAMSYITISK